MRLKCLGCDALARIVYLCAAHSPHIVDVTLFRLGLHDQPQDLQVRLQAHVDATVGEGYDAIVMAYGLCGQATAGLQARDIPIIIPRAHDCITLFLGDRARYQQQFTEHPGTYWYALDYVQRNITGSRLSLGTSGLETDVQSVYDEYVEKYGRDNANYLMEVMGAWQDHYDRAVFIDMAVGDSERVETQTRDEAARRGWRFERMEGDLILIRRLLNGDWDKDFLVLEPGHQIKMTYDHTVIGSTPTR
jgi:hypothetical protein